MNSDTFCKDVLEVGTAEIFLKDETINYLITIYSTYLNTIVDGLNFI